MLPYFNGQKYHFYRRNILINYAEYQYYHRFVNHCKNIEKDIRGCLLIFPCSLNCQH